MTARKSTSREFVKAALREKFGSLKKFEAAWDLPKGSATDVLRGRPIARTEQAIADAYGEQLHVLFPKRYEAPDDGESSSFPDNKRPPTAAHRLSTSGR